MHISELAAYEILEEKELSDIHSTGYRLRHKKSGARITVISNDDENKVFYIGFRTPPKIRLECRILWSTRYCAGRRNIR